MKFRPLAAPSLGLLIASLVACSASNAKDDVPFNPAGGDAGDDGGGINVDDGGDWSLDGDLDAIPLDPDKDNDGDGYLFKDDCNDSNPEVNPGAYDVPGDGVDNDCNGKVDDGADCDEVTDLSLYKSTDAMAFARALGLCKTATAGATGKEKTWGVISAELVRADGSALDTKGHVQHGILKKFGTLTPRAGKNFVVLSSGTARTPDYPEFVTPISPSYSTSSEVAAPAGHPKNAAGCSEPFKKTANDSVNLKLKIRVPTNANSFAYDFDFFSSEYITFVCSSFNDSFVAILDSKIPIDPKYAKNISFDSLGNPVNVNSGFFEVCTPGSKGSKTFACSKGTAELAGTGFWDADDPSENGSTSWLETKAPVQPGEEMTIQFMIWDTGDHILDSTVLLDNWRWDAKPTTGPVTDRPK